MKASEIREMKAEEIDIKLDEVRDELKNLRFSQVSGQLTDQTRFRALRRDIARMLTIVNQRATEVKGKEA